jgi:hypothetical protein
MTIRARPSPDSPSSMKGRPLPVNTPTGGGPGGGWIRGGTRGLSGTSGCLSRWLSESIPLSYQHRLDLVTQTRLHLAVQAERARSAQPPLRRVCPISGVSDPR